MPESSRVNGPYKHGNRWRIVVTRPDGHQTPESFATRAEAERVAAAARSQIEGRTVRHAADEFAKSLDASPPSVARVEHRLRKLLQLDVNGGRPIAWVARRGLELYTERRATGAAATHRRDLSVGKTWGAFCVERGWLKVNPFDGVKPIGKPNRGKAQLRVDESRKLVAACVAERTPESIGVLCAFILGMRATEISSRQVRDVDDGGRLLWIPCSKTPAGRRYLEVPPFLGALLVELAGDRPGEAQLFGDVDRQWVYYHVGRLCKLAGVPVVPPHGLRGTHMTLATAAGQTGAAVAAAVGHDDTGQTADAHYIAPGTRRAAAARAAFRVIVGGVA